MIADGPIGTYPRQEAAPFDELRETLRQHVRLGDLLENMGHPIRLNAQGKGSTRCPFHADHRPSFSVYISPRDNNERFRCFGCGLHGDVFEFVRLQNNHPDHVSTLRALADKHGIPWPERAPREQTIQVDVLTRAATFYQHSMTKTALEYLACRGFPESFVKERRIGYAPIGTQTTKTRLADEARKAGVLEAAIAAGLVVENRNGRGLRDWFWSDTNGYIVFPNLSDGKAVGLQGRAYPGGNSKRSKYLNLPGSTHQLYNSRHAAFRSVVLCEGIPDTLSVMLAQLPNTGACGIMGTQGWLGEWLALFRKAGRIYVALDRDALFRAIDLARVFGTRGRVLVVPEPLGAKGDMNEWLCGPAKRDPSAFQTILEDGLAKALTPYAMLTDLISTQVERWDLEHAVLIPGTKRTSGTDYTGLDLLRELGHHDPLFRDSHLIRIAAHVGLPFGTLQDASVELARENGF